MFTNRYRQIKLLSVLCLLLLAATGKSSGPYQPQVVNPLSESWRWKPFPELEGKGVRYIMEGRDQKVWMSFNNGIFEYNGYSWKVHNAENGLTSYPAEQVFAARNGYIYATTPKGIFRYDGALWEAIFSAEGGITFDFLQIKELSDGSLMACSDQGVLHFSKKGRPDFYTSSAKVSRLRNEVEGVNWKIIPSKILDGGDFNEISDILEDHTGTFWFALTLPNELGRILKFRPEGQPESSIGKYELISSDNNIHLGESQEMIQTADHKIWIINTSYKVGISVFDGAKWEYISMGALFGGDEYMTDIIQSTDGAIWIGSLGKLYAFRNGEWQIYAAPDYAIPANRLMLQKSEGNKLWVGGYKSKIFLLDFSTDRWMTYADLNYQCETGLEQWFLDVHGKAVCRKGNTWTAYDTADGLMDAPIRIFHTSKGQIWAAGSHNGVAATALLKGGRWELQTHPKLSWGIDYRAVFESTDGSLWFGGSVDAEPDKGQLGGVLQLPDPTAEYLNWIHHIYQENGLLQSNAYGIGQSQDGRIWLGGGSLYFYNGSVWDRPEDQRLRQYVNVVSSTGDWLIVGSRYYGIFIYDGKEWRNYDTSSGLSGNTIISIDAISDTCILVATENDICRFDGSTWMCGIFPRELNMEFEGGTIFHDKQGAIWFNKSSRSWKRRSFSHNKTQDKIYRNFVTYRYFPDDNPPETSITLYTPTVPQDGNTLIKWQGLDFFGGSAAPKLTYSFRLNDGEWSPFSNEQHYTFTSLPSGDYRLEVRARDLDFNIDPTPASVSFQVQPPVWKQPWFILLMLAFLTTLGIYEYRIISKKQKLEKLNVSLQKVNEKLEDKSRKIESQNREILLQQEQILAQAKELEASNKNLGERNHEIQLQRDQLEQMVGKVEELSKAKLGFFTNISHELRTPLTLILGPVQQLQTQSVRASEPDRRRLYDIIERNASRLLKLINQLLEIRRIENSSLELNLHEIRLSGYLGEIIHLFENLAIERDVYLHFNSHCQDVPAALDPDKIEKIMVNLLSNAFKHTPDGGSITVTLDLGSNFEYDLPAVYERYFRITVEDTGCGITEEDMRRIFDLYFASAKDKADPLSSGIGLSYIKDLVEIMQGQVRVESNLGEGTRFFIFIPVELPYEKQVRHLALNGPNLKLAKMEVDTLLSSYTSQLAVTQEFELSNGKMERVLIVEDNPDMLSFLEGLLNKKYHVLRADNGEKGLAIARNHSLDLIISDIMMPEMDGLEFCEQIKNDLVTSHIPVILLTARNLEENKLSGYLKGADDYITKPFNPELLEVRIENLLSQRHKLRQIFNRDFLLTPQEVQLTSPDEELLNRLVKIMKDNLEEPEFNVNKMCEMVHLSHMHFIRKVKQLTGKKPIDLLRSFRMKRAKDLLCQNKLTISEVAYKVGYDLPNSFSRAFKKEFGISPTEFVEQPEILES